MDSQYTIIFSNNRLMDNQSKKYISIKKLLSLRREKSFLKIITRKEKEDITESFFNNLFQKKIYKNGSGFFTCPKEKLSKLTIRDIAKLVSNGEKFQIIDKTRKEDITNEILEEANAYNDGLKRYLSLPSIDESEFKKRIIEVYKFKDLDFKFNFIDLFCGAGGLSTGLEMAGMSCLFGVDINRNAFKTFKLNHKKANGFCGDIKELSESILERSIGNKKVHLLAGGPPCQGFSTVGKGDPDNPKNKLFFEYCRILKLVKPDYIVFENVTGILAKKNRETLNRILDEFDKIGFKVQIKVLEASKFGVPQKRKRAIILGTKTGYDLSFPKESFDTIVQERRVRSYTVKDALDDIQNYNGEIQNHDLKYTEPFGELNKERLKYIPEGSGIRYKRDEDKYLPKSLKYDVNWDDLREKRFREIRLFRFSGNLPAPTINTKNVQYYHPYEDRRFTARELAKFQSFPNEFQFQGKSKSQIEQIGNAVPPVLGKAIGESILKSFQEKNISKMRDSISIDNICKKEAFRYDDPIDLEDEFDKIYHKKFFGYKQ